MILPLLLIILFILVNVFTREHVRVHGSHCSLADYNRRAQMLKPKGDPHAMAHTRWLTFLVLTTALLVGISSGANLGGALRVARRTSDAVIVVIFCDGGDKYLSERFWDDTAADGVQESRT